jgi:hypothetical protein
VPQAKKRVVLGNVTNDVVAGLGGWEDGGSGKFTRAPAGTAVPLLLDALALALLLLGWIELHCSEFCVPLVRTNSRWPNMVRRVRFSTWD